MPRVLKQETVLLLHTKTLVFVLKMVSKGTLLSSQEAPLVRAPMRRDGTLKVRTRPTSR